MNISTETVNKLFITDVPDLDPITVFLEDLGPRQGKATITCYGESWTSYWGGMGDRTIAEFMLSCDEHYLAKNFAPRLEHTLVDIENMAVHARMHIIKQRRAKNLDDYYARELYDKAERLEGLEHDNTLFDLHWKLMQEIFGDEWWNGLPTVSNHKYEYLCRIINTVKEAIRQTTAD